MASLCAEHHHHHHLVSPKNSLQDLNILPRKILSRLPSPYSDADTYFMDQKFLPCKGDNIPCSDDGLDPDSDPYSSDQFRMYEFKVRKCTRSRSHDWTDCPFSHPGEKARRRDPRRFHYSGTVCPEYRRSGGCSKGDDCEFAHGVFECWLHPTRYRTEACKDGKGCKRKVCFFAHTPRELRVLPAHEEGEDMIDNLDLDRDFDNHWFNKHMQHQNQNQNQNQCCKYCCAISPTSTLMEMSHFSSSPPPSPMKSMGGGRGLSRYADRVNPCLDDEVALRMNNKKGSTMTYEDMLIAELIGSMDDTNLNESVQSHQNKGRGLWVDVGGYDNNVVNPDNYINNYNNQQMMQLSFSPPIPTPTPVSYRSYFSSNNASPISVPNVVNGVEESPDLGWVNDLLT